MRISIFWIILAIAACIGTSEFGVESRKVRYPISNRSYQVPLYNSQGVQYYSAGPLYTALPTVLIPSQVGIQATPIANVVVPQQSDVKPVQEIPGTLIHPSSKTPVYKLKYRSVPHGHKRPTSYYNYIYPLPVKSYPVVQGQKVTAIKADSQYQQSAPTTMYQTSVVPTYAAPKPVEYPKKVIRIPGSTAQTYYRRVTAPVHRHPVYPPKKVYLTETTAKGHFHYYPNKHFSYPKALPTVKYSSSSPITPTEPSVLITTRPVQESTPIYTYNIGSEVRFPADQETVQPSAADSQQTAPGEITRAIIRNQEVNNYDTTLPLKIPAKKPYQFEVASLIKNPGLQFLQDTAQRGEDISEEQGKTSYTNGHSYAVLPVVAANSVVTSSPGGSFDIYNMATYQSNQISTDQDLATSKTVKIPVAVIRGVHDLSGSGYSTIRQDTDDVKKTFTPSKRTSDWIPMSNGVSGIDSTTPEIVKAPTKKYLPRVEEIISGKIPREFSPDLSSLRYSALNGNADADERGIGDGGATANDDGDIVTGKISYQDDGRHRQRKGGSYMATIPSTGSGGTSNHVVSSVIKFSR